MRRSLIPVLVLLLCFLGPMASAQVQPLPCATDWIREGRPDINQIRQAEAQGDEAWTRFLGEGSAANRGGALTIPCVVHIIQTSKLDKVSEADVYSQIQVLNEDFRKIAQTPGFGTGVDTQIEFCLATIDPNNCRTTGINRIISPLGSHNINQENQFKSLIQWDPNKYLNIWVPERIEGNILGYATFPTWLAGSPGSDGIVVHGEYFGRDSTRIGDYYQGRTASHEVGHWLGLYHTFQDGCVGMDPQSCATAGDRVCDTPPVTAPNFSCPFGINTCNESPIDLPDQIENYMDYSNGTCMNAFTQGQTDRMNFHISMYRDTLVSAANKAATGCDGSSPPVCAPGADFISDLTELCTGIPQAFRDLSEGWPTTWQWTATGSLTGNSSLQNPSFGYGSAGDYTVKLEVSNAAGNDTEEKVAYISVRDGALPPYDQGFESLRPVPEGWSLWDEDGRGSWARRSDASHSGNAAFVSQNYQRDAEGSRDVLISRSIDFSGQNTADLEFYYAYKRFNAFKPDTFKVQISTDCGATWTTEWERTQIPLATTPGFQYTSEFVPAAADWERVVIDLNAYAGNPHVRVAFANIGRNGQSLWLDDINLSVIVGRDSPQELSGVSVWPNPGSGSLNLTFEGRAGEKFCIQVLDLQGRELLRKEGEVVNMGKTTWQADQSQIQKLVPGVYFLQLEHQGKKSVRKLIRH